MCRGQAVRHPLRRLHRRGPLPAAHRGRSDAAGAGARRSRWPDPGPRGWSDRMSTEHWPIEHEPRRVRPPYEVRDDSLDHIRSDEAWRLAVHSDREAALREPLAGLPLTGYEYRQLRWLAG